MPAWRSFLFNNHCEKWFIAARSLNAAMNEIVQIFSSSFLSIASNSEYTWKDLNTLVESVTTTEWSEIRFRFLRANITTTWYVYWINWVPLGDRHTFEWMPSSDSGHTNEIIKRILLLDTKSLAMNILHTIQVPCTRWHFEDAKSPDEVLNNLAIEFCNKIESSLRHTLFTDRVRIDRWT